MADIIVEYKNQLRATIRAERATLQEIWDSLYYTFPNFQFTPAYKSGRWDGKIRLLNLRDCSIYKNMLPKLMKWAQDHDYSFDIEDKAKFRPVYKFDPAWLDRWAEYGTMEPMEHQRKYIADALKWNQALLLSPTSSGKSYIMYLSIRWLLENTTGKILITVPSTSLVEQMFSDFEEYAVNWNVGDHVHKIYDGAEKTTAKRVILSTWQSIVNLPPAWYSGITAYFCDEAHQADKDSITGIVDKLENCPVRIALTGTLNGTKVHEMELKGRFGPTFQHVTTAELMRLGLVAKLSIVCKRLKYTQAERKAVYDAKDYDHEIDYIVKNEKRNQIIVTDALECDGNALILFNFVERHGDVLYNMLQEQAEAAGKIVFYLHGKVKTEERERIRKLMETRDDVIMLASYGVMSTGVSVKSIRHIFFAHPFKARIKNLQSIGRGLRLKKGKTEAVLHDYGDDFCYTPRKAERKNHLFKHFVERLKIYAEEEFDYEVEEVQIV